MADVPSAHQDMAARLAALAAELRALTDALAPDTGWYAAFARREGGHIGDWLAGRDLPPWDILADLLQDLAGGQGAAVAERAGLRLRAAYRAAVRAQDALPGSRAALTGRLAELDRAERELADRERQLSLALDAARRAGRTAEAERLAGARLWARDDRQRVRSRRAEARSRLHVLPGAEQPPGPARRPGDSGGGSRGSGGTDEPGREGGGGRAAGGPPAPRAGGARAAGRPWPAGGGGDGGARTAGGGGTRGRTRADGGKRPGRPRGARFAGLDEPAAAPAPPPPAEDAVRQAPVPAPGGSRFAGAVHEAPEAEGAARPTEEETAAALGIAERLRLLRADGRGGAAHVLLSEAAGGPAARLPVLLAELERTGMHPDVTTLLWEAAALPPAPLAAAARALAAAGREEDCGQLLRQAAARPAAEAGVIAGELAAAGRANEAVTLLTSLVRSRPAAEAARAAAPAPRAVVPLLLDAALRVSSAHHWAVTSELRRAGLARLPE
ncbi:hypothetical protein [Streptomyces marincola]|uniref:hypothetical protein n=1 Tax=Streptomyces marincola TaxID=2878388 RepID=UPI001CF4E4FD|nr:hypothetical protein [Streptomyces marincola]UCM91043.1 hypothetical protein LC193_25565 [Streptomyces marincola]